MNDPILRPLIDLARAAMPDVDDVVKLATVTAYTAAGTLVRFDGESSSSTKAYLSLSATGSIVGSRVLMVRVGGTWVVGGVLSAAPAPHFHARMNAAATVTGGTVVIYTTVVDNLGGGTWTVGTGRWTAPISGRYRVMACYKINGSVPASDLGHQIRGGAAGGTVLYHGPNVAPRAFTGDAFWWEGPVVAGDQLSVWNSAVTYTTQSDGVTVDGTSVVIDYVRP